MEISVFSDQLSGSASNGFYRLWSRWEFCGHNLGHDLSQVHWPIGHLFTCSPLHLVNCQFWPQRSFLEQSGAWILNFPPRPNAARFPQPYRTSLFILTFLFGSGNIENSCVTTNYQRPQICSASFLCNFQFSLIFLHFLFFLRYFLSNLHGFWGQQLLLSTDTTDKDRS